MGNIQPSGKQKLWTSLSTKEIHQLHDQIISEYPFLSNVYESMLVTDNTQPDCPIVFANDQFEKMTLYSKEEILGRNCRFLQGKYTDRQLVKKIREAVDKGTELDVEILNYRKDGVAFWNSFLMLPVHMGKSVKPTHFIAIQKDVTLLKGIDSHPKEWSPPEVAMWMEHNGWSNNATKAVELGIDGKKLLELEKSDIQLLGIFFSAEQNKFMEKLKDLKNSDSLRDSKEKTETNSMKSYRSPSISSLQQTLEEGKNFWYRKPATDKVVFKCYVEGKEPWLILMDQSVTLKKLSMKIEKAFGTFKILFKDDEDYTMEVKEEEDLKAIMYSLQGSTISLHLERIKISLPKSATILLNNLPLPILFTDACGFIIYLNKEMSKSFDLGKKSDFIGRKYTDVIKTSVELPNNKERESYDLTFLTNSEKICKCTMIVTNNFNGQFSFSFFNLQINK